MAISIVSETTKKARGGGNTKGLRWGKWSVSILKDNIEKVKVKSLESNLPPVVQAEGGAKPKTEETVPQYIPPALPYYTNELAALRVLAVAIKSAEALVTMADNSNKKNFVAPDCTPEPIGPVFLTSAKAMQKYNSLLSALHNNFWAGDFVEALHHKLDFRQVCGCQIRAVKGLQSRVNRHLGIKRKEYSLQIDHTRNTEPCSKEKTKKVSDMISHATTINNSWGDILTEYDDDTYHDEKDIGQWTIGGCCHAYILAELLQRPNASKNLAMQHFVSTNRDTIEASYIQTEVIKAFQDFAGTDLPRWHRLLSLVGYGSEVVLRGDVVGLTFGLVRLEKHLHSRRASTWYSAPLDKSALFEASCALCGKPFKTRIKWGDIQSGRIFSCGCTAPRTMYKPALDRLAALALGRYHAKKSECTNGDKPFLFVSPEHFLESVGLPWSKDCLDLSRFHDDKYKGVPYAPGLSFWECSSANRTRGAKTTRKKLPDFIMQDHEQPGPCYDSTIKPYPYAPGFWETPTVATLLNDFWEVDGSTDRNPEIKSSIKIDTCKFTNQLPRGGAFPDISMS